jgi:hypothetical protein
MEVRFATSKNNGGSREYNCDGDRSKAYSNVTNLPCTFYVSHGMQGVASHQHDETRGGLIDRSANDFGWRANHAVWRMITNMQTSESWSSARHGMWGDLWRSMPSYYSGRLRSGLKVIMGLFG